MTRARLLAIFAAAAALTTVTLFLVNRPPAPRHAAGATTHGVIAGGPPAAPAAPAAASPAVPASIAESDVAAPRRSGIPRSVHRGDVERLARRFVRAWTTLETGQRDAGAQAELVATIDQTFSRELAQEHLPANPEKARLAGLKTLSVPGNKGRWMVVVHLIRHASSLYLQLDIRRTGGRLLIHGFSD